MHIFKIFLLSLKMGLQCIFTKCTVALKNKGHVLNTVSDARNLDTAMFLEVSDANDIS